jgi:hypothetical protein
MNEVVNRRKPPGCSWAIHLISVVRHTASQIGSDDFAGEEKYRQGRERTRLLGKCVKMQFGYLVRKERLEYKASTSKNC